MTQYIDKSALVAEIKRLIKHSEMVADHNTQITELVSRELDALYHLISFLDTLEVKEVDLEKELEKEIELIKGDYEQVDVAWNNDFDYIARYFFELGLKAQKGGMIEALRTEYEKGRADIIADTLSWLANVWPQYCNNPNIIDAYKEGVVKD